MIGLSTKIDSYLCAEFPASMSYILVDRFHKWRRICYSFVFMLITPTGLALV